MIYKKNHSRFSNKGRGEYISTADFIEQYYCDLNKCREFFFTMKWPTGFVCDKCGCTHYYFMSTNSCYRCVNCHHDNRLLSNTCFKDSKLPMNKLLYGLFLVFTDKRSISSMKLAEELKVNYKTACLLQSKCRILMRSDNLKKTLDSGFYESDVAYIGAPSKGKQGMGTDKQAYLITVSTGQENRYPLYIKMIEIEKDNGKIIKNFFDNYVKIDKIRLLNTDGKTTFNILKKNINVKNEKINYEENSPRLWFLNKVVSNFSSMVLGVYHGVGKRLIPLYLSEYEWRFNHRNTRDFLSKISHYLQESTIMTQVMIKDSLDKYALERGLDLA